MLQLKQFVRNYNSEIIGWLLVLLVASMMYLFGTEEMKTAISISFFYFVPIWIYQEFNKKRQAENSITK